jgi:hypothetical protein
MHLCRSEIFGGDTAHDFGESNRKGKHVGLPLQGDLQGDSSAATHEV